ncbi:MAG: hypothetical protein GXY32_03325 [Ruminococcaceae bacterium]|mgnify:CR=1 FL=1|nr:hypothetical protein [Oscillospiraceae bacterium]
MCSSFVYRRNGAGNMIIAMNYDNPSLNVRMATRAPDLFMMKANGGMGYRPSCAFTDDGTFINMQLCDSNKRGRYRPTSDTSICSAHFTIRVANKRILPADMTDFLSHVEMTNNPRGNVHNMVADVDGNIWVVEPGRGFYYSPMGDTPYVVMTNFSLIDYWETGVRRNMGAARYDTASNMLDAADDLTVQQAFDILQALAQEGKGFNTDVSMVYSSKEKAVYYCMYRDFKNIQRYSFQSMVDEAG